MFLKYLIAGLFLSFSVIFGFTQPAQALRYDICKTPKQSLACAVAFEKLRTIENPLTGQKYFENGIHIQGNKLLKMPRIHIAQPDLDKDGFPEIIAALSGNTAETQKLFCKQGALCAHYIIQDRNPDPSKPRLRHYHVIGYSYAYGVGLSTNERLHNYRSLRIYKTGNENSFHVYQYDRKTDQYFDLGQQGDKK